jgi:hypothetical protein
MFDVINGCKHLSLCWMESKAPPLVEQFVITGNQLYSVGVQLDQVEKIDGRGIIQCTSGRRFSTRSSAICSTKQIDERYLYMYPLQENYNRAIARIEEYRMNELRRAHRTLIDLVSKLDPDKDQDLISEWVADLTL